MQHFTTIAEELDEIGVEHDDHSKDAQCMRCAFEIENNPKQRRKALRRLFKVFTHDENGNLLELTSIASDLLVPLLEREDDDPAPSHLLSFCADLADSELGQTLCLVLKRVMLAGSTSEYFKPLHITVITQVFRVLYIVLANVSVEDGEKLAHNLSLCNFAALICQILSEDTTIFIVYFAVLAIDRSLRLGVDALLKRMTTDEVYKLLMLLAQQANLCDEVAHEQLSCRISKRRVLKRDLEGWSCSSVGEEQIPVFVSIRMGELRGSAMTATTVILNRPMNLMPRTEIVQTICNRTDTDYVADLLCAAENDIFFGSQPARHLSVQVVLNLALISNFPQMPVSPYIKRTALEQQQFSASTTINKMIAQSPNLVSNLKRLWLFKRKQTVLEFQASLAREEQQHIDMENHHNESSLFLALGFRIILNLSYVCHDSSATVIQLLPWLPLAYKCLKPPTEVEMDLLLASRWQREFRKASLAKLTSRSRAHVASMYLLSPTLTLRLLEILLQDAHYASLVSNDDVATSQFSQLSRSEFLNIRQLITEPMVHAILRNAHKTIKLYHDRAGNVVCIDEEDIVSLQRLGIIELESALLAIYDTIETNPNLTWPTTIDIVKVRLDHLYGLTLYGMLVHTGGLVDFDKSAGNDRPARIIKAVAAKYKTLVQEQPHLLKLQDNMDVTSTIDLARRCVTWTRHDIAAAKESAIFRSAIYRNDDDLDEQMREMADNLEEL